MPENTLTVGDLEWFYREVAPVEHSAQAIACATLRTPVLLLHGLPAQSYMWRQVMPILGENGQRAIAPDWIGSGFSAKPDKRDFAYTPQAYLNALDAFIQALELEKFSLIVQGFLASVGIAYAFAHPERIDRLVILNTPLSHPTKLPWLMKQWGLPFVGDMVTQDPLLVDRTLEGGSGFVIAEEDLMVYRRPFLKTSAVGRALLATTKHLQRSTLTPSLEQGWDNWEKPTAIIWGMADPWLTSEFPQQLAQKHSNIEFIPLEQAKHYPQEHWPQEVNQAIVNFLRRQSC